jgi:hypothetical protein
LKTRGLKLIRTERFQALRGLVCAETLTGRTYARKDIVE